MRETSESVADSRPIVSPSVVLLIPCYNEALTIGDVIEQFRRELPGLRVVVGDNNSSDGTAEIASRCGAEVIPVRRQGKGAVIRTLFRNIDADVYIMVDGDATYPADQIHDLLVPVVQGEADMVVGDRMAGGHYQRENQRPWHGFGNRLVVYLINVLFRTNLNDILSGYRVFSRRFVKNCPVLEDGFTLETTMTLHALDKLFVVREIPIYYRDRPEGSESKLSTYRDGFLVLRTILWIFKDNKPLWFFLVLSVVLFLVAAGVSALGSLFPVWLAPVVFLASAIGLACGFILDTLVKFQRENFEVNLMRDESIGRMPARLGEEEYTWDGEIGADQAEGA